MNVLAFLIVVGGVVLLCYPSFSGFINDKFAYREIEEYQKDVADYSEEKLKKMLETASAYNQSLPGGYPADPFTEQNIKELTEPEFRDFPMLQPGAMLGYVEIPAIDVYLPVYYGTSAEVLKEGLGLVENSSLPVGGVGTHAVISGHTGMASKKMFSDLNLLKEKDLFFIHVLNQHFAYQVDQIKVVWPTETDELQIQKGKDYVTLLTCTPFGVNDHRLLVRGTRIDYDFDGDKRENTIIPEVAMEKYLWIVVLGSIIFMILIALIVKKIRKMVSKKE